METIAGWKANDEVHNYALWGAAGNRRVGLRGVEFESHVAVCLSTPEWIKGTSHSPEAVARFTLRLRDVISR